MTTTMPTAVSFGTTRACGKERVEIEGRRSRRDPAEDVSPSVLVSTVLQAFFQHSTELVCRNRAPPLSTEAPPGHFRLSGRSDQPQREAVPDVRLRAKSTSVCGFQLGLFAVRPVHTPTVAVRSSSRHASSAASPCRAGGAG